MLSLSAFHNFSKKGSAVDIVHLEYVNGKLRSVSEFVREYAVETHDKSDPNKEELLSPGWDLSIHLAIANWSTDFSSENYLELTSLDNSSIESKRGSRINSISPGKGSEKGSGSLKAWPMRSCRTVE